MDYEEETAVVLFSGGQDSTTCLYWAKNAFSKVIAIGFNYGQRHVVELEQARQIADLARVEYTVVDLRGALGGSALLESDTDLDAPHQQNEDLPASFVPGRNGVFLTIAAAHAYRLGIRNLVGGMCQVDYSGYPDCRREFIDSMEESLSLALDAKLRIHTPVINKSKAEIWRMANELGVLDVVRELSHTDYNGNRDEEHDWGYGRLDNEASRLRANGWQEAKEKGWI